MPDELPRRLDLRGHVGEAEIHRLMLDDRFAEGAALVRVLERGLERGARHAHRLRRDANAPAFEVGQRDAVARALGAEQIGYRHAAVFERDLRRVGRVLAELFLDARDHVAGAVGRHDEGADALLAGCLVGDGEYHGDIGVLAAGDELLHAVEDIMIALALRARGDRACVRSRMRFGQTEASEQPALRQRLEEIVLLRVARIAVENIAHQGLYAGDGRGRAVAGGDFLQGQRERDVIQPRAAPLLGNGDAEQAHRRHLVQRIFRKRAIAIPARGIGGEAFGGEGAHRVADHSLFLAEDHDRSRSRSI